jgi:hypothetical protein
MELVILQVRLLFQLWDSRRILCVLPMRARVFWTGIHMQQTTIETGIEEIRKFRF